MATQLTADDARESLNSHVAARGAEINAKNMYRATPLYVAQVKNKPEAAAWLKAHGGIVVPVMDPASKPSTRPAATTPADWR